MLPRVEAHNVTVDEISRRLRVSVWTVYRWLKSGQIPFANVGNKYLVSEGDLARFLKTRSGRRVQRRAPVGTTRQH